MGSAELRPLLRKFIPGLGRGCMQVLSVSADQLLLWRAPDESLLSQYVNMLHTYG